jgi:ArsR family transcriptional regulator, arsenate/arsenite/antimonite-responsive transcriptional repressor
MVSLGRKLIDVFKALGDPTRFTIIRLLAANIVQSLSVTELAERIGITQQAASQHLKILKNIGILKQMKKGYYVYYYIDKKALHKINDDINEIFKRAFMRCEECPDYKKCNDKMK